MAKIELEEVKKLAKLSRLEFSDKELESFVAEFEKTLEYVNKINSVDTSSVDLKEDTLDAENELRQDEIEKSYSQEQIIKNAPQSEDGAFLVPTTVEEGGAWWIFWN